MKIKSYNPKAIESKWQKYWQTKKTFVSKDNAKKKKKYILVEFPYPSGVGLHSGHLRPYVAADVYSRYYRLRGFEVMFPMGWDAFGLPAENFALKNKVHPSVSVAKNIANAKKQMLSWGLSFDWSREVNTTVPSYYKWTQWIFLQLYKKGLAYDATGLINWCPKDKTGLANEEVINGKCERCGETVEKKELRQWYLKITAYAESLLQGLKDLPEWAEPVIVQQANWIGKKTGVNITYKIDGTDKEVTVFTTRPDTNFGATFVVIGPEHPLIKNSGILGLDSKTWKAVESYQKKSATTAEIERTAENRKKTGVFTGLYCVNNLNNRKMPLYVADYVLGHVGTGAVVGVPGHDKRDFEFAQAFNIEIVRVVQKGVDDTAPITELSQVQEADGVMVNSDFLDGMNIHDATERIMNYMEEKGWGKRVTTYKLRDWVFSRQRYWGEPIPIIHCHKCGTVPVPDKDLPVELPKVKNYEPTGTGESPLANIAKWVNVKCPNCKEPAKRETNTMPQWAGSSWYWLRFTDPKNKKELADKKKLKYWTPVDTYFGGMEHTTLHLLYSRFWNQFLYDQKIVTSKEPYTKRVPHGIILGPDGEKMSKSRGNVVDPQVMVKEQGADTLRMFELFLGPHAEQISWNDQGAIGIKRFLEKVWYWVHENMNQKEKAKETEELQVALHKLIKKVGEDIEVFHFNTSISAFMSFMNEVRDQQVSRDTLIAFLTLLYPFAPHMAEELHQTLKGKGSLQNATWPKFNPKKVISQTVEIIVQVNGKLRDKIQVKANATQTEVEELAKHSEKVSSQLTGDIIKVIFVPGRIINFVV